MNASAVKSFTVSNFLAKAAGVTGLALIAYDSHRAGQVMAPMTEREHKSGNLSEHYFEDMKLENTSAVKSEVKKRIFNFYLDEHISDFFATTAGYLKGFGMTFVNNVVPFGLAVGTFFGKKGARNLFSKTCAIGLVGYAGITLLQDAFGIGKAKE